MNLKFKIKFIFLLIVISLFSFSTQQSAFAASSQAEIWDNGAPGWTTTFTNGDPVDISTGVQGTDVQTAIDSTGIVYIVYTQHDGALRHLYISRYDGTDVRIWDNDTDSWITNFANGDPIDTGAATSVSYPQVGIDSNNKVYISYTQSNGAQDHIYLSRYNGVDVRIWDNGAATWTTTFADGDPIDKGTATNVYQNSVLAIDHNDKVYITYTQSAGSYHIFLSRYDGTDVRIWDNGVATWTTTFADGDPIDAGGSADATSPHMVIDHNNYVYVTYIQTGMYGNLYLSRYDGASVKIWYTGSNIWTTNFSWGSRIDNNINGANVNSPQLAVDSDNNIYIVYNNAIGSWPAKSHVHVSRYDGVSVKIWDNNTASWTTTFTDGDPVDTGYASDTNNPRVVVSPDNKVYIAYRQSNGAQEHIYLSRYDGISFKIWDKDTAAWTTTFTDGDPVDTGTANNAIDPQIGSDSDNNIYVTYRQSNGSNYHIYLSRYDGTDVRIWDNGITNWTATMADGDPIDNGSANNVDAPYLTVSSSTGSAYLSYGHYSSISVQTHIYLSRYYNDPVVVPTITSSAASSVTATSATLNGDITVTGGEDNTIRGFEYGLTTAYGTATSTTGSYSTGAYTATITGLAPNTTYHYRAFSTNSAGTSSSTDQSFTTLDINSPVITILGDNPAFVNQDATYTDAGATSTDTVDGDLTGSIITTNNVNTAIIGNSSVVYTVSDSSGNSATSTRVVTVLDITAPTLSAITATPALTSATITWTTSEPATSQVQYGPSSSYGDLTTTSNLSGTTTHSVTLPNLLSCTNYHYRVISADLSDNTSTSTDYTFSISGCTSDASVTASTTEEVTTASGATITIGDLTLYVPVNYSATTSSAIFQAKSFLGTDFFLTVSAPPSFLTVGDYIYNLEALINATTTLTTFSLPLTITMSYDPATLGSITESSLVIYRYDAPTWTPLSSCSVNTTLHTVTCTTTNFSDFGLFGQVAVATPVTTRTGGTHFGCKDPKATNYEFFSSHRQSLCQYALIPTTPPITIQISTSTATTTKYLFTRNLKLYMTGPDVLALQQYLNTQGFTVSTTGPGSKGAETTMFGGKTQAALIKFQKANGITPAVGYFGPVTRGWVGR